MEYRHPRRVLALLGGVVVAAACSKDFCNNLNDMTKTFQSKLGPCLDGGTLPDCPIDVSTCETEYGKCSSSDQQQMNQFMNCFDNLPVCQPAQQTSWELQAAACSPGFPDGGVSQTCSTALTPTLAGWEGCLILGSMTGGGTFTASADGGI